MEENERKAINHINWIIEIARKIYEANGLTDPEYKNMMREARYKKEMLEMLTGHAYIITVKGLERTK